MYGFSPGLITQMLLLLTQRTDPNRQQFSISWIRIFGPTFVYRAFAIVSCQSRGTLRHSAFTPPNPRSPTPTDPTNLWLLRFANFPIWPWPLDFIFLKFSQAERKCRADEIPQSLSRGSVSCK